jgi:hypothetical protein
MRKPPPRQPHLGATRARHARMSRDDLDVLADRSHTPSVWRASVALLLGGILLPLGACTSGTPCNSRKCGGPGTLPPFAVHMAIDGKRVPLSSHRTPIKIGRPGRIDVFVDRASGVDVKNVYVFVNRSRGPSLQGPRARSRSSRITSTRSRSASRLPPGGHLSRCLARGSWTLVSPSSWPAPASARPLANCSSCPDRRPTRRRRFGPVGETGRRIGPHEAIGNA